VRVAVVCGRYEPERDGVAGYVARLVEALAGHGVDARVRPWAGLARARRRLAGADLVHVQFAPSAYGYRGGVGMLPVVAGRPVLTTLHEYGWWSWRPRLDRLAGLGERAGRWDRETLTLVPRSRRLVTTTEGLRAAVRSRFPHRDPLVIPIGANVRSGHPGDRSAARRSLGLAGTDEALAFFGFVHPVKGLRHLLDALALLRSRRPRLRLLVVGGFESLALPGAQAADFEREIRAQVARLGLTDAVTVTGYLPEPEVSRHLTAADVGVLPFTAGVTTKSGSLLTLFEHDLPVVATRPEGGVGELAGAVQACERRDVPTLAAAVEAVLTDPGRRDRLVAGGRRVLAGRGWDAVAAAHVRLYEELAGAGA
jgi:glycosyltransferase involved in cell wall biosynthesis